MKKERVFVGVSGGVDSSVSLLRLMKRGYSVVAVFIRTWQPNFIECTWKRERLDAMRVAAHLGVPFLTFNAEQAYKENVAEYMIREYKEGRTPNPDVMCNEHVKFGVFYDFAQSHGADYVATGHYADIRKSGGVHELHRGADPNKDQSYFLWSIKKSQLPHVLFPVGNSRKPSIRMEAKEAGLTTSEKKDSQGICFLGAIDIHDFLKEFIDLKEGDVLDTEGHIVGTHHGALLYTIGQRHGFSVTTKESTRTPHYVLSRDLHANTITVGTETLTCVHTTRIELSDMNLLTQEIPTQCEAQFRYRQTPFRVQLHMHDTHRAMLTVLAEGIDLPSLGQSCVLYRGTQCLGGGIIAGVR